MADAHLLIRECYKCFNERRVADPAELFTHDAVIEHIPGGGICRAPEGYIESAQSCVAAFPDVQLQLAHVEQRGDAIVEVDLVGAGAHDGDWPMGTLGTFKATGSRKTVRIRKLLEIRGGKITFSSLRDS